MPPTRPSRSGAVFTLASSLLVLVGSGGWVGVEAQQPPVHLQIGPAYFDIGGSEHETAALEVAYRPDRLRRWRLAARFGGMLTMEGAVFAYGGLDLPLQAPGGFVLTPSLGAGAYHRGEGPDLGSTLEFRSGIEVGRRVAEGHRISLFVYHLSNASLGHRNPGVEVLGVAYGVAW